MSQLIGQYYIVKYYKRNCLKEEMFKIFEKANSRYKLLKTKYDRVELDAAYYPSVVEEKIK